MAHVLVPVLLNLLLRHFRLLLLLVLLFVLLLIDDLPPQSHRPPSHRLLRTRQRWQPVLLALFAALAVAKPPAGPAALRARLRSGGSPTSLRNNLPRWVKAAAQLRHSALQEVEDLLKLATNMSHQVNEE
jgi:hypothetical protein